MSRVEAFSRCKSLRALRRSPACDWRGTLTQRCAALGAIVSMEAACSEKPVLEPTGGAGHDQSDAQAGSPAVHAGPRAGVGAVRILVGGEEAANGDYQDYVFLLGNAALAP